MTKDEQIEREYYDCHHARKVILPIIADRCESWDVITQAVKALENMEGRLRRHIAERENRRAEDIDPSTRPPDSDDNLGKPNCEEVTA